MTNNYEVRILELEKRLKKLEDILNKEVARLTKRITDADEGFCHYLDLHEKEHFELQDMVRPTYYKVFPQVLATMVECDNILGQPSDDGSDPQP